MESSPLLLSPLAVSVAVNLALLAPASLGVAVVLRRLWRGRRRRQSAGAGPIRECSLAELDPVFVPDALGPTLATEVRFIGKSAIHVPGGTSDAEAWILAVLAKRACQMFEFGTCTGKTTYLWAVNSPPDARVTTLTLAPDSAKEFVLAPGEDARCGAKAIEESTFTHFRYSGTAAECKVTQLYGDSKAVDETPYVGACDLVFVDGAHTYSYVVSDSAKALRMVRPGGLVLWHDYRAPENPYHAPDVYRALNELSTRIPLVRLAGTSIVAYRCPPARAVRTRTAAEQHLE